MARIDYESWEEKKLTVSRLKLDPLNLRLSRALTALSTRRIIAYMFENEEILSLVRAIALKGYFVNEMPIVVMEGSTATVLEGNRRMTACKVLIDPSLAPIGHQKALRYYASTFDADSLKKIRCIIAPTREAANVIIQNRHTGGSQIEKWDGVKQDLWYIRDISKGYSVDDLATIYAVPKAEILSSVFRYKLYTEAQQIPSLTDATFRYLNGTEGFPISTLWRVVSNFSMTKFLGLKFSSMGELDLLLPAEEFHKRYKQVIEDLHSGVINSRTMNKSNQVEAYVEKLAGNGLFDMNITAEEEGAGSIDPDSLDDETAPSGSSSTTEDAPNDNDESNEDEPEENPGSTETGPIIPPTRPRRKTNRLIGGGYVCETKSPRINKIFAELQTIPLKHVNAVSVLFRTLMELVLTQHVNENNIADKLKDAQIQEYVTRNRKLTSNLIGYLSEKHTIVADEAGIERVLKLRAEVEARWKPSLGLMLSYFAKNPAELLPDPSMQEGFKAYVDKQLPLTAQDFNGFVHNVFYPLDTEVLVAFWEFFAPILDNIISRLESSEENNSQEEN